MDHEKEIIENHLFADTSRYQDIIDLPRHQSKAHLPMSRHDRAGQFAPFSALTGYHQLIDQTAQNYQHKQYQTKQQTQRLHEELRQLSGQSPVEVNYFNADSGYYETIQTTFMKVDWTAGKANFNDRHDPAKHYAIPLANIRSIRNLSENA
ncbi:hypothetical protein [uncultured Limosilactobacillus sp.]|uniref:hypothetical protein n=1 Tax=uncultured Limosilactobacillus sp. TaxID=2837629 RepID=UPI0025DC8898|nr:hypothetical protein [uncultured Limosilactobacillus sp.]